MLPKLFGNTPCALPRSHRLRAVRSVPILIFLLIALALLPDVALAQDPTQPNQLVELCLAVADELDLGNNQENHTDTLTKINRFTAEHEVIGETGTEDIEAMTFGPDLQLFAESNGHLGTLNLSNGEFTPLPDPIGTGNGVYGPIEFRNFDGLAYSLDRGIIFGARRRGGIEDLLVAIDPVTGEHLHGYFGDDIDYVPISPTFSGSTKLVDVDDMQFNPATGVLYATMNLAGGGGNLVTIDPTNGKTKFVTTIHFEDDSVINDIEGLSFFNDGTMYGSTGDNFNAHNFKNHLFHIDPATGIGTPIGPFPGGGPKDYEALACLTADAAIVLQKLTNGPGQVPADANTPPGPVIESGQTVTWTYIFTNTGVLTLTNLSLVDDKLGTIAPVAGDSCFTEDTLLGPGQSITCVVTGIAVTGQYSNTGTVTGVSVPKVPNFPTVVVTDTDPSNYFGTTSTTEIPGITIKKYTNGHDADDSPGPLVQVGSTITWTYVVSNTGNVPLSNITVTDNHNDVTPVYVSGDTNGNSILEVGEIWIYEATGIAIEGDYQNIGTVVGTPPQGSNVSASDPSHYVGTDQQGPLPNAVIGDRVWLDANHNGIQDSSEKGMPGIKVELFAQSSSTEVQVAGVTQDVPIRSVLTDENGEYIFGGLAPGDYYVEFTPPPGHGFAQHNVNDNGDDEADSDPLVANVSIAIDDGGEIAIIGQPLTYTISYTNVDPALPTANMVFSATIPEGTTFVPDRSSPGWDCGDGLPGSTCTIPIGTVAPGVAGSIILVVQLDDDDSVVPAVLPQVVILVQETVGRTAIITLDEGEVDLSVDAGFVLLEAIAFTETSTGPTGLPPSQQPGEEEIFLPSVRSD